MYWGLPEGDRRLVRNHCLNTEQDECHTLEQKYGEGFNCDPRSRITNYSHALGESTTSEVQEIVEKLLES